MPINTRTTHNSRQLMRGLKSRHGVALARTWRRLDVNVGVTRVRGGAADNGYGGRDWQKNSSQGALLPLADRQSYDLRLRDQRRTRQTRDRLVAVPRLCRTTGQRGVVLRFDASVPCTECTPEQVQGLPRSRCSVQPVRTRKRSR